MYGQTSNIRSTFVGNEIVDHSDVGGALPVSAAPTTPSVSTEHMASMDLAKMRNIQVWEFGATYFRGLTVIDYAY